MSNLKHRLALIAVLTLAAVFALFPRDVKKRDRRPDGTFFDTTTRRVPLRYGLDLSGGMHLALEVDESKGVIADKEEAIDRALKVVRTRIDGLGVSETVIQKAGNDRIIVDIPGIEDRERAIKIAQDQAFLEFQITDKTQAFEKVLPRLDAIAKAKGIGGSVGAVVPSDTAKGVGLGGLLSANDSAGTDSSKAGASADSTKADSAALPGVSGGVISKMILAGQMPGQFIFEKSNADVLKNFLALPEVVAALPPAKVVRFSNDSTVIQSKTYRYLYMLDARPLITGDMLIGAKPNSSPTEGTIVEFQLSNEGGRKFQRETAKHVKDYMAIVLDKVVMGSPPVINSAIGSRGQITMGQGRDLQAAQDLSLVLKAGALPVPLKVAEVRNIGPSLGQDSIRQGITAGVVALLLILIIMVGYYRFSGFLAILGLVMYVLYTMGLLASLDAVLTLPGMAGLVLSIGMAVDSNVLIFERIREEMDRGKTMRTAINEGFDHAFSAIFDTTAVAILTSMVLYQYGTGPVKGFAVTLIAGLIAGMFTSIFVVRTFFLLWLHRTRGAQTLSI